MPDITPTANERGDIPAPGHRPGTAFLLAQVGGFAAARFAARVAELGLTAPLAGLIRLVDHSPGRSQQSLADELGVLPSKVVSLVDQLEDRELVERVKNPRDRRLYALHLTPDGESMLKRLRDLAEAHERELLSTLDDASRSQLGAILLQVADQHGLRPGVHPGYRAL